VSGPTPERVAAPLAPESAVRLEVEGGAALQWCCTPRDLAELAAGWLVCEGVVLRAEDIVSLEPAEAVDVPTVRARLGAAARARFIELTTRAAGIVAFPAGRAGVPTDEPRDPHSDAWRPLLEDGERLGGLFARMYERASLREAVGGVHTGGLVAQGELLAVVEDVSRHHVVDRLVGRAWLSAVPLSGAALLLSSRISGAIAAKACRAGVAALVSRSIPTDLAASIAAAAGLVLVGRAQRGRPIVYRQEP